MTIPSLRPYQEGALSAISACLAQQQTRILIQSATGTGKTVTFAAMREWPAIQAWLGTFPERSRRMLVIAHREELIDQAAEKIQAANPALYVCVEQGERRAHRFADVVVASIQTLAARKCQRLLKMLTHTTFRLVICDEAHHGSARSYRTVFAHLGFLPKVMVTTEEGEHYEAATQEDVVEMEAALRGWDATAPTDRLLVGFTATPNRADAVGLGCVFQTMAFTYPMRQAIREGYLVPIRPYVVETTVNLDDVRVTRGDFNTKDLSSTVNTPARNRLAVAGWREYADGRPTIAFSVDVRHAHDLAAAFTQDGILALALSGDTPKEERRDALRRYQRGEITVIANAMLFTEGTDLPRTSCILMAKPTKSATLLEQCIGRGLRLFPEKTDCVLIDVVDVARRHSLQTAPVLYGLPPGLKVAGRSLDQAADEWDALQDAYPHWNIAETLAGQSLTLAELGAMATTFDLWTVPSLGAFGQGLTLTWIKTGEDRYRLSYPWGDGKEVLQVSRDLLGQWDVSLELHPVNGTGKRQRILATHATSAHEAAVIAEAFFLAERRSAAKLKDRGAPWRADQASAGQIAALKRQRIPYNPSTITKGSASDLLDLAASRRLNR